ncbi:response regulator transcription factor [Lachnobacterium bovis]|uniref:Stage 0 sporulation protein A homolog n=1 Tax=Lachnobacterium bovis TaxID=140626 RepID=A0A1H9TC12_9FIRM|nr:response regulator transcription factor [Lachnobacterium bovis]SER94153.1 DNA-binding response regulator, NarL/FixJ family, contains REC and HTH domains [Lachnobacterium bovis]
MKKKVILVDDDQLVMMSLKTILECSGNIEVLETGTDGEDAIKLYKKHKPDVVLMDIQMKNKSGLSAAEEIIKEDSSAKILLLTTFQDDEYIVKALNIGAKGYILKQDFESIEPALLAVAGGQTVFGGQVMSRIPELIEKKGEKQGEIYNKNGINDKEMEIIEQVAQGKNNKEISDTLCLSEGTIRNYLSIILEKLELRDRTQLAIFYWKNM